MSAVEDRRGVTHAVMFKPNAALAGATACNIRFATSEVIVIMSAGRRFMPHPERMTPSGAVINCMSCLVMLPAYDEAYTEGSPPESGTT